MGFYGLKYKAFSIVQYTLHILTSPLGRIEVVLIARPDIVKFTEGLGLQLNRPGGQVLLRPRLEPLIGILLRLIQSCALRIMFMDICQEVLDVFPVALVSVMRKNFILRGAIGNRGLVSAGRN